MPAVVVAETCCRFVSEPGADKLVVVRMYGLVLIYWRCRCTLVSILVSIYFRLSRRAWVRTFFLPFLFF